VNKTRHTCPAVWRLLSFGCYGLLALALVAMSSLSAGPPPQKPVHLAVITEAPSAATAVDVLTAELSSKPSLQLLERGEIERVYREQALSAANPDYLKLGQVLGAEGLLLLSQLKQGTNQFLQARLVAVKAGVILGSVRCSWPIAQPTEWAAWLAAHFSPQFPKLTVPARDAIPLSVLNLRCAVRSAAADELERQLTLLTIERLTHQPELFLMERQRMDLLTAEKDLRGLDDSAFWNGSYLLEGVIDRDGYSPGQVTVDATLRPRGGGQPLTVRSLGSRTNLVEVVNRLAETVNAALKLRTASRPWGAADEAERFFQEAQWALKWNAARQAEAGAEAAWALGKRDQDCALARVRAQLQALKPAAEYIHGEATFRVQTPERPGELLEGWEWTNIVQVASYTYYGKTSRVSRYELVNQPLNFDALDRAVRMLSLYADFSQTLGDAEPKLGSPWYELGLQALSEASRVLRDFHFVPPAQAGVVDKLADLRRLARWTSDWLGRAPSVRASYWFEDHAGTHDLLYHSLGEAKTLFRCQAQYGCFWQEQPEECLALYRKLMTSGAFSYIHKSFVAREVQSPRLAAWNEEARRRAPEVWRAFRQELNASTNPICRIEARFVELADLRKEAGLEPAIDALTQVMTDGKDFLRTNNVESCYWHAEGLALVSGLLDTFGGSVVSEAKDSARRRFGSEYCPPMQAMREEYLRGQSERTRWAEEAATLAREEQYLRSFEPYDFFTFAQTFRGFQYSPSNAAVLLPLVIAYKSNFTARTSGLTGPAGAQARSAVRRVENLEQNLRQALNPPATPSVKTASTGPLPTGTQTSPNAPTTGAPRSMPPRQLADGRSTGQPSAAPVAEPVPDPATPVLEFRPFNPLPLPAPAGGKAADLRLFAHRVHEDALVLDFCYTDYVPVQYGRARPITQTRPHAGVAVWSAAAASWQLVAYPPGGPTPRGLGVLGAGEAGKHFSEMFNGAVYFSDWDANSRYELRGGKWQTLSFPAQKRLRLFVVNQRLYAANEETIFEVVSGGASTRVLASCRRRPVASSLDTLDSLGNVTLFPGPKDGLRALVAGKVEAWNGQDWQEIAAPGAGTEAEVFDDAVLLRSPTTAHSRRCWVLPFEQVLPELCLEQESPFSPHTFFPVMGSYPRKPGADRPATTWHCPPNLPDILAPAAVGKSNLCFFVEHAELTNTAGKWTVAAKDGRHATLVCFTHDAAKPVLLPLRFAAEGGVVPNEPLAWKLGGPSWQMKVWMGLNSQYLFIGQVNLPAVWAIRRGDFEAAIGAELKRRGTALGRKEGGRA
jgi:hypothetical protein